MTYTVKPGDTLSKIAMRNGVSLAQLLQANPQISDPNKIKVGQAINVPNDALTTENTNPLPPTPPATPPAATAPAATATAAAPGALGKALADELGALSAKYE